MKRAACAALWLLLAAAVPAQAGVWGYVDGGGVAHVATHQVDSRYTLLPAPSAISSV